MKSAAVTSLFLPALIAFVAAIPGPSWKIPAPRYWTDEFRRPPMHDADVLSRNIFPMAELISHFFLGGSFLALDFASCCRCFSRYASLW